MGVPTILAGIALLAAAGLLLVFFATENETADKVSNWFFLAFYALMAWTVVEVHQQYVGQAALTWLLTVAALGALGVLFVTTLLVVLGRIDFRRIAMLSTVAFLVLLLWMLGVSILIIAEGGLPTALGWLGVGIMTVSLILVGYVATDRELLRGEKTPGAVLNVLMGLVLIGVTVWVVWLGTGPVV
ncbi:MAG TPA: hypothetical protein VIL12_03540 [Acidimicrobiia bacterium]